MRKVLVSFAALTVCAVLMSGCASQYPMGACYTNVTLPLYTTDIKMGKEFKVGTAECKGYLGIVAMGDASIQAAMKSAGITKICHIDWEAKTIFGVGTYKVIVYGE
jgi:hypothetical protein